MIQLKDTKNWEITQDHPRTGRPRTARTPKKIKAVRERIRRNPRRTIKGMAESLGISPYSMLSIVKKRPYKYLGNSVSGTDRNEKTKCLPFNTMVHHRTPQKKLNYGANKTSPHFGTKKCGLLPLLTYTHSTLASGQKSFLSTT